MQPSSGSGGRRSEAVAVDAIVSTIGFPLVGGPAGSMEAGRREEVAQRILRAKNVPYLVSAPLLIQDIHSWTRQGIGGLQSVVLYALPELDGAIDPVPLGGLVGERILLIPERVRRLTGRLRHWIEPAPHAPGPAAHRHHSLRLSSGLRRHRYGSPAAGAPVPDGPAAGPEGAGLRPRRGPSRRRGGTDRHGAPGRPGLGGTDPGQSVRLGRTPAPASAPPPWRHGWGPCGPAGSRSSGPPWRAAASAPWGIATCWAVCDSAMCGSACSPPWDWPGIRCG